jgi:hypothetical protein
MPANTGPVHFLSSEDAEELTKALTAEGYEAQGRPVDGPGEARWELRVTPYDDGVAALVDVYGGWMPDETPGS